MWSLLKSSTHAGNTKQAKLEADMKHAEHVLKTMELEALSHPLTSSASMVRVRAMRSALSDISRTLSNRGLSDSRSKLVSYNPRIKLQPPELHCASHPTVMFKRDSQYSSKAGHVTNFFLTLFIRALARRLLKLPHRSRSAEGCSLQQNDCRSRQRISSMQNQFWRKPRCGQVVIFSLWGFASSYPCKQ